MHLKPRNISLRSTFHRFWHMSGPNPIHSSDGPCGLETQGRRGLPSESTPISLQQSTNGNARNLKRERIIENHRVGISSEPQDRGRKKPELQFSIRPITAKLRPKTSKIRDNPDVSSIICRTATSSSNLIGSAPTKSDLALPMDSLQVHFLNCLATLCK